MQKLNDSWIDVNEALPHPEYHHTNTIGEYLVTVELNDKDENDDPEVVQAVFNYQDLTWRYLCARNVPYDPNRSTGWKVTAWQPLPLPFKK